MEKCYFEGCAIRVMASCTCSEKTIFMCESHMNIHLAEDLNDDHKLVVFFTNIPSERREDIKIISEISIRNIQSIRKTIMNQASELIQQITINCSETFKKLNVLESKFVELYNSAILRTKVNKRFLSKYINKCITDCSVLFTEQFSMIKNSTNTALKIKLKTEDFISKAVKYMDNEAYFCKENDTKLISINLESFKQKILEYSPSSQKFFQSCRVDKNKSFVYGGGESNESYLIDFENECYESLPPGLYKNRRGGCVFKEGIVYIFGGIFAGKSHSASQRVNIKDKTWAECDNLPMSCCDNTAAILRNEIIMSGYELGMLLEYKNNNFTEIFKLLPDRHKIVCTGWVITTGTIYENLNDNLAWNSYGSTIDVGYNISSLVFYRGNFIYFINGASKLIRLDTKQKLIEIIEYN